MYERLRCCLGDFDIVVTDGNDRAVVVISALRALFSRKFGIAYLQSGECGGVTLSSKKGSKALLVSLSSGISAHAGISQGRDLLRELEQNGISVVGILDTQVRGFWEEVFPNSQAYSGIALKPEEFGKADLDSGKRSASDSVPQLLMELMRSSGEEDIPAYVWDILSPPNLTTIQELVADVAGSSAKRLDKTRFSAMVSLFSKSIEPNQKILNWIKSANRQRADCQLALRDAEHHGNDVWSVRQPMPLTKITVTVVNDILATKRSKAIVVRLTQGRLGFVMRDALRLEFHEALSDGEIPYLEEGLSTGVEEAYFNEVVSVLKQL